MGDKKKNRVDSWNMVRKFVGESFSLEFTINQIVNGSGAKESIEVSRIMQGLESRDIIRRAGHVEMPTYNGERKLKFRKYRIADRIVEAARGVADGIGYGDSESVVCDVISRMEYGDAAYIARGGIRPYSEQVILKEIQRSYKMPAGSASN